MYACGTFVIDNNVRHTYKDGMKIKEWRVREGLSRSEMGRRIKRAHTTIMRLESGASVPDTKTMKAIFDATNGEVSLHDFLSADGSPKPQAITEPFE